MINLVVACGPSERTATVSLVAVVSDRVRIIVAVEICCWEAVKGEGRMTFSVLTEPSAEELTRRLAVRTQQGRNAMTHSYKVWTS